MYSNLKITLKYNTNFTPKYKTCRNVLQTIKKKKNKIFCKNFLFFILIIDYFLGKKTKNTNFLLKVFCLRLKKKN
jgi:hypothetical protein